MAFFHSEKDGSSSAEEAKPGKHESAANEAEHMMTSLQKGDIKGSDIITLAESKAESVEKSTDRLASKDVVDSTARIRRDIRRTAERTLEKMIRENCSDSNPATFEECREAGMDELPKNVGAICTSEKKYETPNYSVDGYPENPVRGGEEIEPYDGDVKLPMQLPATEEESDLENRKICLDDVFDGLQRFKEENGNLLVPVSHPVLSIIDKLSSQMMEPFVQRKDSNTGMRTQGMQHSEDVSQSFSSGEGATDTDIREENARGTTVEQLASLVVAPSPPVPPGIVACQVDDATAAAKMLCASHSDAAASSLAETNAANDEDTSMIVNDANAEVQSHSSMSSWSIISHSSQEVTDEQNSGNAEANEARSHPRSRNVRFQPPPSEMQETTDGQTMRRSETQSQRSRHTRRNLLSAISHAFRRDTTDRQTVLSAISNAVHRGFSNIGQSARAEVLVSATLVEEADVVMAEPVGFCESKWKLFAPLMCAVLAVFAILLSLSLMGAIDNLGEGVEELEISEPSSSPTFDPRPTLEIVQTRGHIRCGLGDVTLSSGKGFYLDLCRSVAAVAVGNPNSFEGLPATFSNRWQQLLDRTVDLIILGDTYTIEREIREHSTGTGFTFSSPYAYDGMIYLGYQTFVRCAEEHTRFDECANLKVCVEISTTHHDFLKTAFPSDYFQGGSSMKELVEMLFNGTCNVIASEKTIAQRVVPDDAIREGTIILGNKMMTKEPHSIITPNTDREFSDVINWVIHALIFGEEKGLTKDLSLCNSTKLFRHDASDLYFLNAIFCVGNYGEIYDEYYHDLGVYPRNRGMNEMNNGTGMLYAIPFGNIDRDTVVEPAAESMLTKIRHEGSLNCGVVIPDMVAESDNLFHFGFDYCHTLAAALLVGDFEDVNFLTFTKNEDNSFIALANGDIDVLVGSSIQQKYDFEMASSPAGFHFSTPYYYGNEAASNGVSFYSAATREDDVLFSSFINCIVLATIYAEENGIQREESEEMPLASVFGSHLKWALRDAISFSGAYSQIYAKHFGNNVSEVDKGRNTLSQGGPLLSSFLQWTAMLPPGERHAGRSGQRRKRQHPWAQ